MATTVMTVEVMGTGMEAMAAEAEVGTTVDQLGTERDILLETLVASTGVEETMDMAEVGHLLPP